MQEIISVHENRPHCMYLWYLHGNPVCSEKQYDRPCAYPSWKCPVRLPPSDHEAICIPLEKMEMRPEFA